MTQPPTIISQILDHLRTHHQATTKTISAATSTPFHQVRSAMGNLMVKGTVQSSGSKRGKTYRLSHPNAGNPGAKPSSPTVNRQTPICPSTMPNGSQEFWAKHVAKTNTPARAGA